MKPDSQPYSRDELLAMGVAAVGRDVRVDRSVRLIGAERLRLGNRVRIDCFSLLSAGEHGIHIGDNVHLAAGCLLFGSGGMIKLDDFVGLSARVAVYSATDDYTDGFLTGPTVTAEFRKLACGPVVFGPHAIVGAGSIILPRVTIGFGAAVGALTLVRKNVSECAIVYGNPMQQMPKLRNGARLRELEARYRATLAPESSSPA